MRAAEKIFQIQKTMKSERKRSAVPLNRNCYMPDLIKIAAENHLQKRMMPLALIWTEKIRQLNSEGRENLQKKSRKGRRKPIKKRKAFDGTWRILQYPDMKQTSWKVLTGSDKEWMKPQRYRRTSKKRGYLIQIDFESARPVDKSKLIPESKW